MITFAIFLLGTVLGFTLGAVWSSEVHARKPSPTGWGVPTITSLPRAVAVATSWRRDNPRQWPRNN